MKKILITSGILFHFIGGMAAPRNIQQAQQIAESFVGSAISFYNGPTYAKTRLAQSKGDITEKPYYIFNIEGTGNGPEKNGFVIVSSDDDFQDILGYCPRGAYEEGEMPDGFCYWLETLSGEMEYYLTITKTTTKTGESTKAKAKTKTSEESEVYSGQPSIEPLIKTYWAQGEPFNNMIPIGSTNHSNGKGATGCVATAMAQLMKYWQWPEGYANGRCYNINYGTNLTFVLFDFVRYDWDLMLNGYGDFTSSGGTNLGEHQDYSAEQAEEVAKLMYHCGVATDMKWGNTSTTGNINALKALTSYFDYNKYMHAESRDVHSPREFRDILLNELNNGRPILYWGKNSRLAGHYFICDGFDTNTGMFHFNWGWGGLYDGYYTLSAVDSSGDANKPVMTYSTQQFACVGCHPETHDGEYTPVITAGTMKLGKIEYDRPLDISFTNFTNSSVDFDGEIGIALLQDGEIKYSKFEKALTQLGTSEYFPTYKMTSFRLNSSIEKGDYILCAIARNTDGTYNIIKAKYGTPYMWDFHIDSSTKDIAISPIIVTDDIPDAISNIRADKKQIISTEYFTLSGAKISHPNDGIFIKRIKYKDGSSKSLKIMK